MGQCYFYSRPGKPLDFERTGHAIFRAGRARRNLTGGRQRRREQQGAAIGEKFTSRDPPEARVPIVLRHVPIQFPPSFSLANGSEMKENISS